ncbi:MAG: cell division protein PerM [Nocardioidaceae bacterium]
MTDLLTAATTRRPSDRRPAAEPQRRPLALGAAFAGAVASGSVLVGCMALALVGWFASDAGGYGQTTDALRVAADAWLLGLGAHLELTHASITLVPLGLTLLSTYVAFRLGRWAALTSEVDDAGTAALGTVVLAGIYGVVAVLTAVLASVPTAEPNLGRAFTGGLLVGLLGGGAGIAAGAGDRVPGWSRLPAGPRIVLRGGLASVLLVVAAAALLLTVSLLADLTSAANVLARLHVDAAGGGLATVLVATVTPNAVLLAGSYLLGPGFAVGTGTLVSPTSVVLGPVPAFPLLAALPHEGVQPWWTSALIAVPALAALAGVVLAMRRDPVEDWPSGALRGLLAGLLGGVVLTVVVLLAGGSVGPGRMADVGASPAATAGFALLALGLGGLLGGLLSVVLARRAGRDAEVTG